MNYKNSFFIIGLLLIVIFSASVVFANENSTHVISADVNSTDELTINNEITETISSNYEDTDLKLVDQNITGEDTLKMDGTYYNEEESDYFLGYNVSITTKNISTYYNSNKKVNVQFINTTSGEPLSNYKVEIRLDKYYDEWSSSFKEITGYTNSEGNFQFTIKNIWPGNIHVSSSILLDPDKEEGYYTEDFAYFKIAKAPVTLTTKKLKGTTKSSLLTAFVKDKNGKNVKDGYVKFTINGKSYTAYVENGMASKKVKLPKAKTYKYTAKFYGSEYYKTKTSSSKIVVQKAKKWYTFKAGKYSCKISHKQYMKLINAKNSNKYACVEVKTGKYYNYKKPVYKTTKTKKTKWTYKKVLSFKSVSNSDWSDTTYYDYDLDKYFNNGWTLYGWVDTESDDGHVYKSYAKLKKKVKYTTTKKVKTGYKKAKSPIYMYIETLSKDALVKKGDYVTAWTDGGKEMGVTLKMKTIKL